MKTTAPRAGRGIQGQPKAALPPAVNRPHRVGHPQQHGADRQSDQQQSERVVKGSSHTTGTTPVGPKHSPYRAPNTLAAIPAAPTKLEMGRTDGNRRIQPSLMMTRPR